MSKPKLSTLAVTIGALLVGLSYIVFTVSPGPFLTGAYEEFFSIGLGLIVFGLAFKLWKVKLG